MKRFAKPLALANTYCGAILEYTITYLHSYEGFLERSGGMFYRPPPPPPPPLQLPSHRWVHLWQGEVFSSSIIFCPLLSFGGTPLCELQVPRYNSASKSMVCDLFWTEIRSGFSLFWFRKGNVSSDIGFGKILLQSNLVSYHSKHQTMVAWVRRSNIQ